LQWPHAFNLWNEPERLDALDLQIQGVDFGKSLIGAEVHIHLDYISGIIHFLIGLQIEKLSPQVLLIRDRNLGVIKQERPSEFLIFLHWPHKGGVKLFQRLIMSGLYGDE
jgi:hypothetical protein